MGFRGFERTDFDFDALRELTARRLAALAVVVTVGFVVLWFAIGLFPFHSVNDDEGVYLMQAAMLLEGKLFLYPGALADVVRPWFFVVEETASAPGGVQMYSKYSPVVPVLFALGLSVGLPNLILGVVAAANAGLTYVLAADVFDRETGVVAAAMLGLSPMFLLTSATFLAYAPTTMLNLAFAVCYVRAVRRDSSGYAVVAGAAIGLAFFARPFTAVLFALPFILHTVWTLVAGWRADVFVPVFRRAVAIALPGLAFVVLTLAYNAVVTGDPFVFPYLAFAPNDGVGFGYREILGYDIVYTPMLGIETGLEALGMLLGQWGPMGWFGTLAAVIGAGYAAVRWWGYRTGTRLHGIERRARHGLAKRGSSFTELSDSALAAIVGGIFVSVFVGNGFFWGTNNGLRNGLIDLLGPFYHFDALVPLAVFGAAGLVVSARSANRLAHDRFSASEARGVVFSLVLVLALVGGAVTVSAIDEPYGENQLRTDNLETTYEPLVEAGFEDRPLTPAVGGVGGDDAGQRALVFHPDPYGDWQAHPFQSLRNDPGFDGPVLYVLDEGPASDFAVLDATNRTPYRFTYRGEWTGAVEPVEPELTELTVFEGDGVVAESTFGAPTGSRTVSVRVETESGYARYDVPMDDSVRVEWELTPDGVRVTNKEFAAGSDPVPIPDGASEVTLEVTFVGDAGQTVTYRQMVEVERSGDEIRVIWPPETRICEFSTECGLDSQWVGDDGDYLDGVRVATNASEISG
ncbi:glycosyltransferase family 39 protein [Haloferax namakaokahaiae]|uniref:Glycosyltransferase family 39 protein n=1 Tax=Haloferax namakaokahaiae TaxID=1748331 RepID=A0ABD5ZDK6_9EURY